MSSEAASSITGGSRHRHVRLHELGQTEVENLHPTVARDEHVLWLEIAVNDAFLVRRGKAACQLNRVINGPADRQRRNFLAERLALQEFRDDVGG